MITQLNEIGQSNNLKDNLRIFFVFVNKHQIYNEVECQDLILRWSKIINDN